ncbi:type II restriction endonuclease subunit S [Campylobacter jejuni]|nr:type II restriction endonuclease subunit S [Campylobacter jejuni]
MIGGGVIFDYDRYRTFNELKSSYSIFWKEFNFDEIFLYKRGKRYKKGDHVSGDIAYISSSAFNNDVDNFVSPPSYMTIYQNKLTLANSGSVGTCFYHPYQFVASDHCMVIWLKERELNKEIALFLIPIFERFKDKHGFDWEINDERLRAESFLLPTDSKGNLAFEFMENTIKALKKEAAKNVILYNDAKIKATKKYIKTH